MEKNKKEKLQTRRRFLSLAAIVAGAKVAGKAAEEPQDLPDEKVKMLTPDGQLVEVDKSVLDQAANRKKVTNKDILEWRNPPESF